MRYSFAALCWGILLAGFALSCTKHPKPGPAPEKDYGSDTALADVGRGRDHSLDDMGFGRSRVTAVEFSPIYFALNGSDPLPESLETLRTLVDEAPKYKACRIEGHTCPLGDIAYNEALGYARAQAVLGYLRKAGVRTGFQVTSYGEERLVAFDPAEYRLNRRVIVECDK